ncbi:MAG TPA: HepT-like ribonuclease domain-containing protein [Gemmataceae bacterium]|jgi:uncharacterized protein with HEPN domain|nr:HepT-like ribonuclease domain-containing protein [Gemmataceae bacterium]
MPHDPRKLLQDILSRAEAIQRFCAGVDFAAYQANEMLRLAVERQFEIIGEATNRLLKTDAALAARITDYRRIVDFRNAITHGYDLVDDQLVWDTVVAKLPNLRNEVQSLLAGLSSLTDPP